MQQALWPEMNAEPVEIREARGAAFHVNAAR